MNNLTTIDIRNITFADLQTSLGKLRLQVWAALTHTGPVTTRALAERTGMSLWNVRPRVCELVQLGLVELTGKQGHEGVYRALSLEEARQRLPVAEPAKAEQVLMNV